MGLSLAPDTGREGSRDLQSAEDLSIKSEVNTHSLKQSQNAMPTDGLVFYAPLDAYHQYAETGQELTCPTDLPTFTTVDGIDCMLSDGKYFEATQLIKPSMTQCQFTLSFWIKQAVPLKKWKGCPGVIGVGSNRENVVGICNWSAKTMPYEAYEELLDSMKKAKISAKTIYLFSATAFDEKLFALSQENPSVVLVDMTEL